MPSPPASSGLPAVDATLGGGLPRDRTTALLGPPGTCKRPLAMQFLADGVADGEACLYASATASEDAARAAAESVGADADFDVVSLRDGLDGDANPLGELQRRVTEREALDRLVVDGLASLCVDRQDAIQGLTAAAQSANATVLALGDEWSPELAAGVHGLLRTRAASGGASSLTVERLYGADADRRPVELRDGADGLRAGPRRRTPPDALVQVEHRAVGVPGLDALCGGGLVRGDGVLLRHDGRADVGTLLGALVAGAIRDGYAVELVPTLDLRAERLDALLRGYDTSVEALLDADRLFVLDVTGAWETGRQNVFAGGDEPDELRANVRGVADRTDRPHFRLVDADAMVHTLGPDGARDLRYFQEATLLESEDVLLHVQNPAAVSDEMAALYEGAATQVLATELAPGGRQHITLRKSPRGRVGATALVEFAENPPYLSVSRPPGAD